MENENLHSGKVLDSYWIENPTGTIGLVLSVSKEGDKKAFIGVSESKDEEKVLQFGKEVPISVVSQCFPDLQKDLLFHIKYGIKEFLYNNFLTFLFGFLFGVLLTLIWFV